MERIVGIDLGTTNSLIAYVDDAGPQVVADSGSGQKMLPSIVSFLPNDRVVVGREAGELAPHAAPLDHSVGEAFYGPRHGACEP